MANEVSSISYSGKVSISFVTKSGRPVKSIDRHNKGCRPLFNFITNCMMGKFNEGNRPVYLMLYKNDGVVDEEHLGSNVIPNLQYIVNAESSYDDENNAGIVRYKFIFPGSLLLDDANVIALYSYNNANTYRAEVNNPSNYVEIETIEKSSVENVNIIIVWELKFSNKTSEE